MIKAARQNDLRPEETSELKRQAGYWAMPCWNIAANLASHSTHNPQPDL